MCSLGYKIYIWLYNVKSYYNYKISKKSIIGNDIDVNNEFLFVRRLFMDWIVSNKDFSNLKRYQSFKSILSTYLKDLSVENFNEYYIIWKDFNLFLFNHSQFLLDIYFDIKVNKRLLKTYKLLIFSTVCVNLFYKWKQKRNNSKRSWLSYDNRRKSPSNINMAYFDNIMLNEASYTRYRSFLHDDSTYVKFY